jgi:hypothetical protein
VFCRGVVVVVSTRIDPGIESSGGGVEAAANVFPLRLFFLRFST